MRLKQAMRPGDMMPSSISIAVASRIGKEALIPTIAVRAGRCMCSPRPTSIRSSALCLKRPN